MFRTVVRIMALAVFAASGAQAAAPPPVEAFGNLPAVFMPSLSPDGKHLATIQPIDGRPSVFTWTLGAPKGTLPRIGRDDKNYVASIRWANSDRLLVTLNGNFVTDFGYRSRMTAWYRTVSVDTNGENAAVMFSDALWRSINTSASSFNDADVGDPQHVYM